MKEMDLGKARNILSQHFPKYPPTSALEAETMLHNHEHGSIDFNPTHYAEIYMALQVLRCSTMGESHANDVKRNQRSRGKNLRKARTGSRK